MKSRHSHSVTPEAVFCMERKSLPQEVFTGLVTVEVRGGLWFGSSVHFIDCFYFIIMACTNKLIMRGGVTSVTSAKSN